MKNTVSQFILIIFDLLVVAMSIILAYYTGQVFYEAEEHFFVNALENYLYLYMLYITIIGIFSYEGLYAKRFDFWHESRNILKGLSFSFLLILAYLEITKNTENYSHFVIIMIFIYAAFLIPLFKIIIKKFLFKVGIWQREAKVYGGDEYIQTEIFGNSYLGYVNSDGTEPSTVFINAYNVETEGLGNILNKAIAQYNEVLFIPRLRQFDLTRSDVYQLSNKQVNLISLRNRLNSRYRIFLKQVYDITLAILITPLILPLIAFIAYKIKKEEPAGSVFFKQERLGKNDNIFICYKFRTMREDGEGILQAYLKEYPEEVENYEKYHKYQNDPRITKIGKFLRRTSLDELPQILNVYKREMSFIGPRPYMLNEKEKIGDFLDTILMVRPGITGLWQVSGRSEVEFHERVKLDIWYIQNWNLWMNFVILLKTIRIVLIRDGAS